MKTTHLIFWAIILCILGYFLHLISAVLLPFVVGMGLAYMLDPMADKLEAKGLSRTAATSIISGVFFMVGVTALVVIIPLLVEQLGHLVREIPDYVAMMRERIEPYVQRITDTLGEGDQASAQEIAFSFSENIKTIMTGLLGGALKSGMALANFASLLLITPIVSFYLLRDWDIIIEEMDSLLPRQHANVIREQCQKIDQTLSSFLRGTLNVMLVLATFYAIALSIAGLKYSLLIALVGGVAIIIPFVGTFVSGALAVGVAYMQFDAMSQVAIILAIFVVGQMLEGYVLTPKLVGESVGLNPVWIIFGMLTGGAMMGFVGILIAVPVTAVCGVLLRFAVQQYCQSDYYQAACALPASEETQSN